MKEEENEEKKVRAVGERGWQRGNMRKGENATIGGVEGGIGRGREEQ